MQDNMVSETTDFNDKIEDGSTKAQTEKDTVPDSSNQNPTDSEDMTGDEKEGMELNEGVDENNEGEEELDEDVDGDEEESMQSNEGVDENGDEEGMELDEDVDENEGDEGDEEEVLDHPIRFDSYVGDDDDNEFVADDETPERCIKSSTHMEVDPRNIISGKRTRSVFEKYYGEEDKDEDDFEKLINEEDEDYEDDLDSYAGEGDSNETSSSELDEHDSDEELHAGRS
jgi:hypothetical protein